jgi:membrane protein
LTDILFTGGKYLIAALIGGSTAADLYEAAGSVLVLMLWIYYASAIFLFGATFTFTRAQGIKTNCQDASAPDTGRPVVTD